MASYLMPGQHIGMVEIKINWSGIRKRMDRSQKNLRARVSRATITGHVGKRRLKSMFEISQCLPVGKRIGHNEDERE